MKKIKLLLFFLLGMFCLCYGTDVLALEKGESIIEFIGVRQGEELIKADENGNVYIKKNAMFRYEYKINNINNFLDDNTIYCLQNNYNYTNQKGYEIKNTEYYSQQFSYFNSEYKTERISFKIYQCSTSKKCDGVDSDSERILLDSLEITLHFEFYDQYNFDNIQIDVTEISQVGKVLTPIKMNEFEHKIEINDQEDLTIKIKGENFVENQKYTLDYSSGHKYIFTGKELNEGVELVLSQDEIKKVTQNYELDLGFTILVPNFSAIYARGESNLNSVYLSLQNKETSKTLTTKLKYKNYKNVEIELRSETIFQSSDRYSISPKYHNEDNELLVLIKGDGYLDQDYDVEVNITDNYNRPLYNKKIKLNGLEINRGYEIVLDDFTMTTDFPQEFYEEYNFYKVKTNIENTTRNIDCYYGYNIALYSSLTYPNGKGAFADNNAGGSDYHLTFQYYVHEQIFELNNAIYMTYIGKRFENNVVYDYELYYKKTEYPATLNGSTLITKNKISGLKLNTTGLQLQISNPKNHLSAEYILVVKYNGQIIQIDRSVINFNDNPSFTNIELASRGKNIYLAINNNKYIATKNSPLNLTINGVGFTDDVTYEIPLNVKNANDFYLEDERYFKNYYFTGYELNNGLAKVNLNSDDFFDYDEIIVGFWAFSDEEWFGGTEYSTFKISYIDSKELFKYVKKYIIDNTLDLIKNITEQTTTKSFQENVEIVDNGNIQIYDKDGIEKNTDYIGTGMIARVTDEFEHGILDMDVVVKGDVTGDGKITITDMIKIRRHLANLNKLEGLYEMAGDTTDTGNITITDLMKLRLDLANIAELE